MPRPRTQGVHPLFKGNRCDCPLIGLSLGRAIGARYEAMATVLGGLILLGVAGHLLPGMTEGRWRAF